ncbi:MAG: hypothetical protein AAB065_08265 [Deltaproteobacteria bacterium]
MKVSKAVFDYVSDDTPRERSMKAAAGKATELKPGDRLSLLFALSRGKDHGIKAVAAKTLSEFPEKDLLLALEEDIDPLVLEKAASLYPNSEAVLGKIISHRSTNDETLEKIAPEAPADIALVIASLRERLVKNPAIFEALKKNKRIPPYVIGGLETIVYPPEIIESAPGDTGPRGGSSEGWETDDIGNELESIASGLTEKDAAALPEELVKEDAAQEESKKPQNVQQMVLTLGVSEKIKLGMLGNKEARGVLIKDPNKLVSGAVLKNPRITEDEILKLTATKGTSEDLLRQVARDKDWIQNYGIKKSLITNPKTPLAISIRLLASLNERDIADLSKSKNISTVLCTAAKRIVDAKIRKKKH